MSSDPCDCATPSDRLDDSRSGHVPACVVERQYGDVCVLFVSRQMCLGSRGTGTQRVGGTGGSERTISGMSRVEKN